MNKTSISKEEIKNLPIIKFRGEIVLAENEKTIEQALSEIMNADMVGIDTESKPNFKKGKSNPVAMLQVALPNKVYLLRVSHCDITKNMVDFLQTGNILKIGVALDDDFIQMQRRINFVPHNFIDLNKLAPQLGIENIGVRNLSALFLGGRVSKNQQTSNWEAPKLTDAQINYAATDAWVCLKIYEKMAEAGIV